MSLSTLSRPVKLISIANNGYLEFNKEAIRGLSPFLKKKAVVYSCIGKYRSGKSYLMSRLFGDVKAFKVGSLSNAETKGVWMLAKQDPFNTNNVIIFLDMEGLDDIGGGDINKDMKLFALAVLCSTTLIYNVKDIADQSHLNALHAVNKLAQKWIKYKNNEAVVSTPKLHLVIQQLVVQLVDYNNTPVSAQEYLEQVFLGCSGRESASTSAMKEDIKKMFPKRDMHTLITPADSLQALQHLDQADEIVLSATYKQQFNSLKMKVNQSNHEFGTGGRKHNVEAWIKYLEFLTDNQDGVPNIKSQSEAILAGINMDATDNAMQQFRKDAGAVEKMFPLRPEIAKGRLEALQNEAVKTYKENAIDGDNQFSAVIKKEVEQLQERNNAKYQQVENQRKIEQQKILHKQKMQEQKVKLDSENDRRLKSLKRKHEEEMKTIIQAPPPPCPPPPGPPPQNGDLPIAAGALIGATFGGPVGAAAGGVIGGVVKKLFRF